MQQWLHESSWMLSFYTNVDDIRGCNLELSRRPTSVKVLQQAAVEILSCLREPVRRWREQPWNEWPCRTRKHRIMPELFINTRPSAVFNSLPLMHAVHVKFCAISLYSFFSVGLDFTCKRNVVLVTIALIVSRSRTETGEWKISSTPSLTSKWILLLLHF